MKTTRRQIVSNLLPVAAIISVSALCSGMIVTAAYAQQDIAITVTTTAQQTFEGFGVSIRNPIGEFLPAGGRKGRMGTVAAKVYDSLFKANDPNSLKLAYLRLPLMTSNYKYTSTASYDFNTAVEKTGEGDIIRAARSTARNPNIKLLFPAWTPPYWMKQNNKDYNVGTPGSTEVVTTDPNATTTNRLKPDQYVNYANLLKSFCDNFNTKFGFYPHALSLQNEPDTNVAYSSCVYTANQYKGVLTATRNAFGWGYPTELWGPELGGSAGERSNYVGMVATAGLLDAVAQHSYNGDTGVIPDWAKNNLKVHQTEYAPLEQNPPYYNGDQQLIAATSINEFCKDANRGKVSTWFHWNAIGIKYPDEQALDIGEHLIIAKGVSNPSTVYQFVDQGGILTQGVWNLNSKTLGPDYSPKWDSEFQDTTDNIQFTALYYAFRRLTQSVTPGCVSRKTSVTPSVADGTGSQDDVYAAGFKRSDGKYCLVVANRSKTTSYNGIFRIDELGNAVGQSFKVYYTSSDGNGPVNDTSWTTTFNNGQATATLYPRAVYILVQQ